MSLELAQFKPTPDHPWRTQSLRLIYEQILGLAPEKVGQMSYLPAHLDYYGLADKDKRELCAFGALYRAEQDHVHLSYLAVPPEKQGLGYGRTMLNHLEQLSREAGALTIGLMALQPDALYFFEHQGYAPSGSSSWELYKQL